MGDYLAIPDVHYVESFYFSSWQQFIATAKTDEKGFFEENWCIENHSGILTELFNACEITSDTLKFWFDEIKPMYYAQDFARIYWLVKWKNYSLMEAKDNYEDIPITRGSLIHYLHLDSNEREKDLSHYLKLAHDMQLSGRAVEFQYEEETYTIHFELKEKKKCVARSNK